MELMFFIGVAVLISAIAYFITFWLNLWIFKLFIKNIGARYLLVGFLNAFLTPFIGFTVSLPGMPRLATFLVVGVPTLALMWWRENQHYLQASAKRR